MCPPGEECSVNYKLKFRVYRDPSNFIGASVDTTDWEVAGDYHDVTVNFGYSAPTPGSYNVTIPCDYIDSDNDYSSVVIWDVSLASGYGTYDVVNWTFEWRSKTLIYWSGNIMIDETSKDTTIREGDINEGEIY
jgi:hypothetical protein